MDTSDFGLSPNFIVHGVSANGLTDLKTRCWSVSSFSIATQYTRALSPPQKKEEELSQKNVGTVPKKLFADMYFLILLCEELTQVIVQVF